MQQRLAKQERIVLDRAHRVVGEELGEHAMQQAAVLQHVRHAARAAAIVLEHAVLPPVIANDVGADHVGEDGPGRKDPDQLALVLLAREHELGRDHAVLQALLVVVDVADEEIERGDPLHEPGFELLPLDGRDDPRHEIEREDALDALLLAIDGEGDALVDQAQSLQPLAPVHLGLRERLERGDERLVVTPRRAGGVERFVVSALLRLPFHGARIASLVRRLGRTEGGGGGRRTRSLERQALALRARRPPPPPSALPSLLPRALTRD